MHWVSKSSIEWIRYLWQRTTFKDNSQLTCHGWEAEHVRVCIRTTKPMQTNRLKSNFINYYLRKQTSLRARLQYHVQFAHCTHNTASPLFTLSRRTDLLITIIVIVTIMTCFVFYTMPGQGTRLMFEQWMKLAAESFVHCASWGEIKIVKFLAKCTSSLSMSIVCFVWKCVHQKSLVVNDEILIQFMSLH